MAAAGGMPAQMPAADPNYAAWSSSCKSIAFFNHKGGVAKTSSVFAVGEAMAARGAKVLMIDGDVQRNLTEMALHNMLARSGHDLDTFIATRRSPCLLGKALGKVMDFSGMLPVDAVRVATFPRAGGAAGELHLVMGDDELTQFEERLTQNVGVMFNPGMQDRRDYPGAPYHLALMTAHMLSADFVLWDLSPNISTLNRLVLACSDYFVMPCFPDYYTDRAISAMTRKIIEDNVETGFVKKAAYLRGQQVAALPGVQPCRYVLPVPKPTFLGIFVTRYNLTSKGRNAPGGPARAIEAVRATCPCGGTATLTASSPPFTLFPITPTIFTAVDAQGARLLSGAAHCAECGACGRFHGAGRRSPRVSRAH